ncbi:MAG: hypothetical protein ABSC94_22655 [Polyangiaceae bacterium]
MKRRFPVDLALFVAAFMAPAEAEADVSSWLAVGGGYAMERDQAKKDHFATALTYSIGVGSSPLAPVVVGGLVRGTTFLDYGTDIAAGLRGTTGGFARGDWGAALEVDAVCRPWGGASGAWPWRNGTFGAWPLQAVLTAGSPWGFQLAFGAEVSSLSGGPSAVGGFATLEIDLLRLTVMRQGSTEHWWYNPAPAGGHLARLP